MSSDCASNSVSVVIPSHNEGENLRRTVDSLLAGLPADGEIIVVDDASEDGSAACLADGYCAVTVLRPAGRVGAIAARNLGARRARGEVVVFCDAHVTAPLGWTAPLIEALARPEVGAVSPVLTAMHNPAARGYGFRWRDAAFNVDWLGWQSADPHTVPLLGAGCLAMRRAVFEAVGGFDEGLIIWGAEDAELCLRLWLLGYECVVVPRLEVAHLFRAVHPYRIEWEAVLHNNLRVAAIHFGAERLRKVAACAAGSPAFPAAFARLADSDAWERRKALHAARRYDDDWFFERFTMAW